MDGPTRVVPDENDEALRWKLATCMASVCVLKAASAGDDGEAQCGTGWVVHNDTVAALVTARHMLKHSFGVATNGGEEVPMVSDVTAVFSGGWSVRLASATALLAPALPESVTPD